MELSEVKRLKHGLYHVFWKDDGGHSLAAVGSDRRGRRWLAPTNWLISSGVGLTDAKIWHQVERIDLIEAS